jgi:hypothetical protein
VGTSGTFCVECEAIEGERGVCEVCEVCEVCGVCEVCHVVRERVRFIGHTISSVRDNDGGLYSTCEQNMSRHLLLAAGALLTPSDYKPISW